MATLVPPGTRGIGTSGRREGRPVGFPVPGAAAIMSGGKRPLRLLCLHGYGQNRRSFHERTGALRKALRGRAELVSVSAPHPVPGPEAEPEPAAPEAGNVAGPRQGTGPGWAEPSPGAGPEARAARSSGRTDPEAEPRGWWLPAPQEREEAGAEAAPGAGLEAALAAVARAFAELGPFDGLLGFSQGAALAAVVCALQQRGDPRFPLRFAVLIAGFRSRAAAHGCYYREPIALPSLHVLGESDRLVPAARSRELAAHFLAPALLAHPGGHFVPAAAPQRRAYLEFLARF
ncbi:esterase OVCA2 [Emydura macquarii macquarii]|uniref:esterase OVCA2 n=1 Tax=Emydura macquarii macquarii TaxID=1129001 RepID=UPI00352B0A9B